MKFSYPIKKNSRGDSVKIVQISLGATPYDGIFGNKTAAAVKKKLGKAQIDNEADLMKVIGSVDEQKAELFKKYVPSAAGFLFEAESQASTPQAKKKLSALRKVMKGESLTEDEKTALNEKVDTVFSVLKGLKEQLSNKVDTVETDLSNTMDAGSPEADSSSGNKKIFMWAGIGLGAVILTVVAVKAFSKKGK